MRALESDGALVCGQEVPSHVLRDGAAIEQALARLEPTDVVVAAGRAGGIGANRRAPADLMEDNLRVVTATLPAAHRAGVRTLLYLASSCAYPRACAQPMTPDSMWTGPLEPTSEAYATAKLAGLMLCRALRDQHGVQFMTGVAGDVYGPDDTFDPEEAHVVAGLVRRMHDARVRGDDTVTVWGSGRQVRDLIYVDDLAAAVVLALTRYGEGDPINLSSGIGTSIAALATVVREVVGYEGTLKFDTTKPDGAPMKVLDASVVRALGFTPRTPLRSGIERTHAALLAQAPARHEPEAALAGSR